MNKQMFGTELSWVRVLNVTLFRAKNESVPSFFSVTCRNVEKRAQKFLNFNLNSFETLVQNLNVMPSFNPNSLNMNQVHPSKILFFLVIIVMMTSLMKMLELTKFSHMATSTLQLEPRNRTFLITSYAKIMTS